jgi:Sialidase, N-terminal domain.
MRIGIGNTIPERVSLPGQSGGTPVPPGPPALAQVSNVYSMEFDGTNDFIDLGDSDVFSFGNSSTDSPFSISAWVNMTDATSFVTIAKDATSNREYVIRTLTDDKLYFYLLDNVNGGYIGRISSGTVTSYQGTWIHTVYTYNGNSSSSGIKIYLNGSPVDNTNYQGGSYTAMSNTVTSLNIGRQEFGVGTYANGKMDEVAVFNTALTDAEILSFYNATETGKTLI